MSNYTFSRKGYTLDIADINDETLAFLTEIKKDGVKSYLVLEFTDISKEADSAIEFATYDEAKQHFASVITEKCDDDDVVGDDPAIAIMQLRMALEAHDWFYMMSDDSSAYDNGSKSARHINKLAKKCGRAGKDMVREFRDKFEKVND